MSYDNSMFIPVDELIADNKKITQAQFTDNVSEANAIAWCDALPEYLRKGIDKDISSQLTGEDTSPDDWPEVYAFVSEYLGYNCPKRLPPDPLGSDMEVIVNNDKRRAWVKCYNHVKLVRTIIKHAKRIQHERGLLSGALGLKDGVGGLPDQGEGLDDAQASTVRWICATGESPLEYLTSIYRSEDKGIKVSDRIAASKALLDFVHKRLPSKVETKVEDAKINVNAIKGLSAKELDALEALLKKAGSV